MKLLDLSYPGKEQNERLEAQEEAFAKKDSRKSQGLNVSLFMKPNKSLVKELMLPS